MEIGTRWFKSNTTMYIAPLLPIIKDKIKGDIAEDMPWLINGKTTAESL